MNRRWVCPRCRRGVNAPSRPRMDDVRRYCLPCSAATGRLVERTCPARETAAQARAAAAKEKVARQVDREEDAAMTFGYFPQLIRTAFARYARLRAWGPSLARVTFNLRFKGYTRALMEGRPAPETILHYARYTSGHCYGRSRIVVTVGYDPADAHLTLLHELAHAAAPSYGEGHGRAFYARLHDAIFEVTGARIPGGLRGHVFHAAARARVSDWLYVGAP